MKSVFIKHFRFARRSFLGAIWFCFCFHAQAQTLEELIKLPQLWEVPARQLAGPAAQFPLATDEQNPELASNTAPGDFLGVPVEKVDAFLKEDKLAGLTLQFFTSEPQKQISRNGFELLLRHLIPQLSSLAGSQPVVTKESDADVYLLEWNLPRSRYQLHYSFTREDETSQLPFKAHLVSLKISPRLQAIPAEAEPAAPAQNASAPANPAPAEEPIERSPNGDVFIANIPVVKETEGKAMFKATVERALRHYGLTEQADKLAAEDMFGTGSYTEDLKLLRSFSRKLGVQISAKGKFIDAQKRPYASPEFEELMARYDRLAKRQQLPGLKLCSSDSIGAALCRMQSDLLLSAYPKVRGFNSALQHFSLNIQEQTGKGVLLLWNVMLGVFDDERVGKRRIYGHPRLIVGYNANTSEVLYSDCWDSSNQLKRMNISQALAITLALNQIAPNQLVLHKRSSPFQTAHLQLPRNLEPLSSRPMPLGSRRVR